MEILSGREALENLCRSDDYLFHGSPKSGIEKFTPQEPLSRGHSKGVAVKYPEKVFFATEYLDVAIFAAVVFHLGRSGWYTHDESTPVTFTFNADADVVKKAKSSTGYVYVLPKIQFKQSKGTTHEYISETAVTPLYCVKVDAADVRPALDELQPDPDPSH